MNREKGFTLVRRMRTMGTVVILLSMALPAMSQLTTLIESVEVSTAVVRVPTSLNGRMSFKPCESRCDADYISVRLTPETRFVVQGQATSFADFRRDFNNSRGGADGYALISYDTEKNIVMSVEIAF